MTTEQSTGVLEDASKLIRSEPAAVIAMLQPLLDSSTVRIGEKVSGSLLVARAELQLGRLVEGEKVARRALHLAREHDMALEEALCMNEIGIFRFLVGDHAAARNFYDAALDLLSRMDDRPEAARVHVNIGNVHQVFDEDFEAIEAYNQAAEIARRHGDILTLAKVNGNLSALHQYVLLDLESAQRYADAAADLYARLGDDLGLAKLLTNRGSALYALGRYHEAEGLYRESIARRGEVTEPTEVMLSYYGLVSCCIRQGKRAEARAAYDEVKGLLSEDISDTVALIYLAMEAWVHVAEENGSEALLALDRVRDLDPEWKFASRFELEMLRASALVVAGQYQDAAELARDVAESERVTYTGSVSEQIARLRKQLDTFRESSNRGESADSYVSMLAHELKSPLDSIRAIARTMKVDLSLTEQDRIELSDEIHRLAIRMMNHVRASLEDVRGRDPAQRQAIDATPIIRHLVETARITGREKSIDVTVQIADKEMVVMATEQMLVTIVENLLSNAMKYSQQGMSVIVSTKETIRVGGGPALLISIADSGPGITEADRERLYRPFQRGAAVPTGKELSHGLGLYLVKRAVDALDGRIWVESAMEGGATFFVEVPLVQASS